MTSAAGELHWVQQAGSIPSGIVRPATVERAAHELAADPALRPVAGGSDLLLELARDRSDRRVRLLDTTTIAGFDDVRTTADGVVLGAGVTHADVVASPEMVAGALHIVRQACLEIGSPQLRNRATLVGNLVTASPANDTISALLALDVELRMCRLVGAELEYRTVKLADFYDGFRSTVLEPAELVTSIHIPAPAAARRGIWVKAGLRKAQAISVVHAGIVLEFEADQPVARARIALGSVGPTVELNPAAADELVGAALSRASILAAADAAAASVQPIDDGRATADYRRAAVRTVVERGLTALLEGTEKSQWPTRVPRLFVPGDDNHGVQRQDIAPQAEVAVAVNGTVLRAVPTGAGTLLDWLRDVAGTGTKEGCAEGECGACTVQMNGAAVMSCLVPAAQADGARVTTVEGIGRGGLPTAMQQAFVDKFAVQCGYCIPGFIVAAQTLADELGAVPTREEIELSLSGNLCRCTGYYNIIDAVQAAIRVDSP